MNWNTYEGETGRDLQEERRRKEACPPIGEEDQRLTAHISLYRASRSSLKDLTLSNDQRLSFDTSVPVNCETLELPTGDARLSTQT